MSKIYEYPYLLARDFPQKGVKNASFFSAPVTQRLYTIKDGLLKSKSPRIIGDFHQNEQALRESFFRELLEGKSGEHVVAHKGQDSQQNRCCHQNDNCKTLASCHADGGEFTFRFVCPGALDHL